MTPEPPEHASPEIDREHWPAVVIGAGVGGIVAARLLADRGVRTLLVEAKPFPREKVCGGCLNPRALSGLAAAGFAPVVDGVGGTTLTSVKLYHRGQTLTVATPEGLAVSRGRFDAALLQAATEAGVHARLGMRAAVQVAFEDTHRQIVLTSPDAAPGRIEANVVIVADGLGAPSLARLPEFSSQIEDGSKLGVGVVLNPPAGERLANGQIHMAVGEFGYAGLVCCEEGRLDIAGAFAPEAIGQRQSIGTVVKQTLVEAGIESPEGLFEADWLGTRQVTQANSRLAAHRIFLIGDAAGYVEPFTGEGMAAAIEDALAVAPLAAEGVEQWRPVLAERWQMEAMRRRSRRQRTCRRLAWMLERPWATQLGMRTAAAWPALGARIADRISSP